MAENFTLPLGNEFHIPASNHLVLPTVTVRLAAWHNDCKIIMWRDQLKLFSIFQLGVVFITVLVATIFTVFTINRYITRCAKVRCDLCGEKIR